MPPKSFTAILQRPEGVGTWTYLTAPFDVLAEYGVKGQVKVKGTINGVYFRGSLMPHGDGRHFLVVKKALRDQARATQGSVVKVSLDRDTDSRAVSLPRDVKQALAGNPQAAAAKKDVTLARRIAATIEKLAAGPGRPR